MSKDSDDIKAIKEILERIAKNTYLKRGFICQWCGHKTIAPKGGTCPNSPNNHHQYVKADVEEEN